jgi:hypothetical protein
MLVEILNLFGVKFTSLTQNFLKIGLLLIAHHSNVCCRSGDALRLTIPNYLITCPIYRFPLLRLSLRWLLLVLLAAKNIWSLAGKSAQVLCYIVSTCKRRICLPLYQLLLLFFPFRVHDTYLEMLSPVTFRNILLAIRALLGPFSLERVSFSLVYCLAHIVFNHFHFWVECRPSRQLFSGLCFNICVLRFNRNTNLARIWHAF